MKLKDGAFTAASAMDDIANKSTASRVYSLDKLEIPTVPDLPEFLLGSCNGNYVVRGLMLCLLCRCITERDAALGLQLFQEIALKLGRKCYDHPGFLRSYLWALGHPEKTSEAFPDIFWKEAVRSLFFACLH